MDREVQEAFDSQIKYLMLRGWNKTITDSGTLVWQDPNYPSVYYGTDNAFADQKKKDAQAWEEVENNYRDLIKNKCVRKDSQKIKV